MAFSPILSKEFENDIKGIKDGKLQSRIKKMMQKILDMPGSGKTLRYGLAGLRMSPFRIIYEINGKNIILHKFDHRKSVY